MSFRLVPNSVTLDDLEWRNSLNCRVISPNSVAFGADYVKVVEDTSNTFCSANVGQRIQFCNIGNISFMSILAGDHFQRER